MMNNGEPFLLQGGNHGVLLVHGFTGVPMEMALAGDYLQRQGYTVLGVRLAGHGTCPEDMARMTWQDWQASVEDGYALLRGLCPWVSVVGLSMGGLLSLCLAAEKKVESVVSLAAPVFIHPNRHLEMLPPRSKAGGRFLHRRRKFMPVPAIYYQAYRRMPLVSVYELLRGIECMKDSLSTLHAPLLVMQSREDHTVLAKSAQYIYDNAASAEKEICWLEKSGHLLTVDSEREYVFQQMAAFLAKYRKDVSKNGK